MPVPAVYLKDKDKLVLLGSAVFRGLNETALGALLKQGHPTDVTEGTILIKENFFSENLYVVLEGNLHVTLESVGSGFLVASIGPGDAVGEFCLLEDKDRRCSATVRAANRCRALRFGKAALLQLFSADPAIGYVVMGNLARLLIRRLENSNDLTRSLVATNFQKPFSS
ncbi:MAG: cyclic nucleotide-binding domain-containing protein [Silvanigrellales bacterium]|nr:cyclic nucleotide-binding domain-containing protein [Silvanigrellales bacterium]